MDVMDIEDPKPFYLDVTSEHWKSIELALVGAPVIAISPLVDETSQIRERDAIIPSGMIQFVRKAGVSKFATKKDEGIIWNGNFERGFRGHDTGYTESKF
jgi:hypothetical protein